MPRVSLEICPNCDERMKDEHVCPADSRSAVLLQAKEVLHGETNAAMWMRGPIIALNHRTPADLLESRQGRREILASLMVIDRRKIG